MSLAGSMTFNNVLNATECVFNFYDYVYRKTAIKMHSIDQIYIHKREVHEGSSLVLKTNGNRNGCNKFSDIDGNVCVFTVSNFLSNALRISCKCHSD